jgi:topoisomerase-4 subunit B
MTDADVDGAHIASLLMTYFFLAMTNLVKNGNLYLAKPPLYRLIQSNKSYYARDDKEKNLMLKKLSKNKAKIEIGRFKGLGEMNALQLKETTMDPAKRSLLRVQLPEDLSLITQKVEQLMGKKAEHRLQFIQEQRALMDLDI